MGLHASCLVGLKYDRECTVGVRAFYCGVRKQICIVWEPQAVQVKDNVLERGRPGELRGK